MLSISKLFGGLRWGFSFPNQVIFIVATRHALARLTQELEREHPTFNIEQDAFENALVRRSSFFHHQPPSGSVLLSIATRLNSKPADKSFRQKASLLGDLETLDDAVDWLHVRKAALV